MAGINTLLGVYEQRGDAFLKSLLSNYVIINKQMNGSFFGMSVSQDGSMRFYKNGGEISQIDRILMKYYDPAIAQMEAVAPEIRVNLPSNFLFGMEYIHPGPMDENASPQSCLTMSYIRVLDNGPTPKYIHGKELLDKWADAIGINRAPILFAGKLNEEQKSAVLDLVYTPQEKLLRRFKAKSFTTHLLEMLGSPLLEDEKIDEIVFRFYENQDSDENVVLAKIIDPVFAELIKTNEAQPKKLPNDYLYLIIIDLMNFIESYNIKDLMAVTNKGMSFEDNYVALVDKIYLDFIDKFKYKYLDVTLQLPDFMQKPEFDLNVSMIKSDDVRDIVNVSLTFKEIYKILLNFFRKKKNKPTGLFNSALVLQFNKLVDKIKNVVIGTNVAESYFPSFYEFSGSIAEEFDYISALTIKQRYEKYKKARKVNIIVDYFQPITNDHVNAARLLKGKNGLPTVLVVLNTKFRSKKFPLQQKTVKRMAQMVRSEYGDFICDVVEANSNSLDSIVSALHPQYQPLLWGAPKNRMNDYLLQMDFAKNKRVVYNISRNFKLMELPVNSNCQRVIDMIRGENYQEYKEYVPKSIHSEFFNLKAEIGGQDK